jgi:hypothetical protein
MVQMPGDAFSLARLIVGAAVLIFAVRSDVLTRRVNDACWWLFLAAGLMILEAQLIFEGEDVIYLLSPFYIAVFFMTLWFEGEVMGDHVRRRDSLAVAAVLNVGAIAIYLVQVIKGAAPSESAGLRHMQLLSVPLMMLLAYLLYRTQLLSGGADAKAFLSLAVLVPFYPVPLFDPLGIPAIFLVICPFVLALFFNAAFFTLLNPAGLFFYNLARGDLGRLMFFAYRLPLEEARTRKFIWLSESVEDKKRIYHYFRFRDQTGKWKRKQLDMLGKAGAKKVWVQPQIPFMVQLAAGFVFTIIFGNIILYGIIKLISGL